MTPRELIERLREAEAILTWLRVPLSDDDCDECLYGAIAREHAPEIDAYFERYKDSPLPDTVEVEPGAFVKRKVIDRHESVSDELGERDEDNETVDIQTTAGGEYYKGAGVARTLSTGRAVPLSMPASEHTRFAGISMERVTGDGVNTVKVNNYGERDNLLNVAAKISATVPDEEWAKEPTDASKRVGVTLDREPTADELLVKVCECIGGEPITICRHTFTGTPFLCATWPDEDGEQVSVDAQTLTELFRLVLKDEADRADAEEGE